MQSSDIPTKFPIPFANAAGPSFSRPVPTASQIGVQGGAASLTDGFPPLNFLQIAGGGVPPWGADMNGLMNQVTKWILWVTAGGAPSLKYDATYSTNIGGYPKGAFLQNTSNPNLFWINQVENNTNNPDTGGANWLAFPPTVTFPSIVGRTQVFFSSGTFTVPADVTSAEVTLWGAGGAGGASSNGGGSLIAGAAGGGGGGGGYCYKRIFGLTPGATIAVTVGTGGIAVANPTVLSGNGSSTSFGAFCTGGGGGGSIGGNEPLVPGGVGGSATGGDINVGGATGGSAGNPQTFVAETPLHVMNKGGLPAVPISTVNAFGTGSAGRGFGAGGTGASGGVGLAGGNGAPGLVIVRW